MNEDFRVFVGFFRHEVFHSDLTDSQDEEVIIGAAEVIDWGRILLRDPHVANIQTPPVTIINSNLLAILHSGEPGRPGIKRQNQLQEPSQVFTGRSGGFVDTEDGRTESVEALSRTTQFNSQLPDVETPDNNFLNTYIKDITGIEGRFDFNKITIDILDQNLVTRFSKRELFLLYDILNLSLPDQSIVDAEFE